MAKEWQEGDQIELKLPLKCRYPDCQIIQTLLLLPMDRWCCTRFGGEKMIIEPHWFSVKPTLPEDVEADIKDYIVIQEGTVEDWLANIRANW